MMGKAVRVVRLQESDEQDFNYWLKRSPARKLDTLQYLREMAYDLRHESRKGLQRFLKVTRRKKD
jgi:predicted solute-binding protein